MRYHFRRCIRINGLVKWKKVLKSLIKWCVRNVTCSIYNFPPFARTYLIAHLTQSSNVSMSKLRNAAADRSRVWTNIQSESLSRPGSSFVMFATEAKQAGLWERYQSSARFWPGISFTPPELRLVSMSTLSVVTHSWTWAAYCMVSGDLLTWIMRNTMDEWTLCMVIIYVNRTQHIKY